MADAPTPSPLVSRRAEFGDAGGLQVAMDGTPQVAIVDGHPGTRKTALVSRFVERNANAVSLRWVRCDQSEAGIECAAAGLLLDGAREPTSEIDAGRRLFVSVTCRNPGQACS